MKTTLVMLHGDFLFQSIKLILIYNYAFKYYVCILSIRTNHEEYICENINIYKYYLSINYFSIFLSFRPTPGKLKDIIAIDLSNLFYLIVRSWVRLAMVSRQ